MSKKILLISHHFPPDSEVGGRRIALFSRYLPEFGMEPLVLSVDEAFWDARDSSLVSADSLQVYRTGVLPNPLSLLNRIRKFLKRGQTSPTISANRTNQAPNSRGLKAWIRKQVFSVFYSPNDDIGWFLPAALCARTIVKRESVEVIFSSGPPWAAHLVAWCMKKMYGVHWAADFRDPWTLGVEWSRLPKWRRIIEKRLEAACMRSCDLVICNTDRIKDAFIKAYPVLPADKFVTITNGFDDFQVSSGAKSGNRSGQRLMVHLGSIYGARRSDNFFQALANLAEDSISDSPFKVLLVGDTDPTLITWIETKFPHLFKARCIEFKARVSWHAAQEILQSADVLLLFQGLYTQQVPAKFYEYLPTGKPIFAVVEEGALTDLLQYTGAGVAASPNDITALQNGILQAFSKEARTPEQAIHDFGPDFHYRSLTRRLVDVLHLNDKAASTTKAQHGA